MNDDLPQQLATLALVLGAGIYVFRRAWITFYPESASGSGSGCGGGCSTCPSSSNATKNGPEVISIGMPSGRGGKSV